MRAGPSTRERILEASRRLFNEKGYSATTLTEIASSIGIAQGNLTYHFPTKRDLVAGIEKSARAHVRAERARLASDAVSEDYVDLLFAEMDHTWEHRFLLRDRTQFTKTPKPARPDPDMVANFELLHAFLKHMETEGMFRRDLSVDTSALARSLWIVSRYWVDHLRELEGVEKISLSDRERGLQNYFAVLLPYLTASGKRDIESAIEGASTRLATRKEQPINE